jgi:MoaD family protein
MEITVHYFTVLRNVTKKRLEKIRINEGSSLKALLAVLIKKYGENFERYVSLRNREKRVQVIFLLNGQDVAQFNGLGTQLHDGDSVSLMPPIAGG